MMPHRRSRPVRTRIKFPVEVRGSRQSFDAQAHDVSVGGLCLSSPILLAIDDRAGTTLHVPDEPGIPLSFEVRWARPEGTSRYLIGGEIVHTSESLKAMQRLMWQIDSGSVRGGEARTNATGIP